MPQSIRTFSLRHRKKDSKDLSVPDAGILRRTISPGSDRLSIASTAVGDASSDPRGPLGLNLLYAPSKPLFDFVFVHGLGGGSRRTWSKTNSISHYWPGEWLPKDPAFKDVRIHSYGYDSDWAKGNDNCLNIHHIGKSLLGELSTSPHIADSDTSLVLIGHSMGGLVIKKAYMLAHQESKPLAERVRAIYFLGTPHRGSDSARLLKNILQVASSAPGFVTDLVRGSGALQSTNDEFRRYSADVELWSFYETQKLRTAGLSTLIVDPESATLGYREEKQMPMTADHRSICKFDDPSDQNYVIIRNALASTIKRIDAEKIESNALAQRGSIRTLASFLGATNQGEDDLFAVQDARVPGTCEWILEKQTYNEWKDLQHDAPPILWFGGKPATGKSVLAGFVVDDLRQSHMRCSYYFFKHGDTFKSKLSACLRSLAYQMASADTGIRESFIKLQEDRLRLDHDNERNLWRSLFTTELFRGATVPHYWVIDALDECTNFAPFLDSMLSKVDTSLQLRIFITSRETPELCRLFAGLGPQRHRQGHVSADETLPDIERIVTAKGEAFFTESVESREALEKRIIEKSKGSFLWTMLVLDELSAAFSQEDIKRVLDEVPRGMEPLYQRALDTMALATRGKPLAKAILIWTTCAMRPLELRELQWALETELMDKFPKLGESIRMLCGQFVTVDKNGRVHMVHETARELLLSDELDSEFAVNRTEAHTRIAKVCLECLTRDELKPRRTERKAPSLPRPSKTPEFLGYATTTFSSHLAKADPTTDHVLSLVDKFLRLNVLTWICNIAETGSLGLMIRAAEDLKVYATSCMVERSPLRRDIQRLRSWSVDLQRVAAKFADALILSPSSIYSRIPPFCPTDSAIRTIAAQGQKLSVTGIPAFRWDDRLSCLDFGDSQTSALCYGDEFLAVGLRGGQAILYHLESSQEYRSLEHGETVLHLQFREKSDMLASAGLRMIRIWNVRTGQKLHQLLSPRRSIGLVFHNSLLIAASTGNEIHSWDLDRETPEQTKRPWRDWAHDGAPTLNRPPSAISIAVEHQMMAVAYSGNPITVWDFEQDAYYGTCGKKLPSGETSTHPVVALVFNPNARIELLAASYLDGELVIIDPFTDEEVVKQRVSCHTLAASPDGRLLAGGGAGGVIQIFEFDTLRLLYKVKSSDIFIKTLAFSRDGFSLADLRGSQCNIWIPPVLLEAGSLDESLSVDTSSTSGEFYQTGDKVKITALAMIPDKGGILCGKDNGSVFMYDINSGDQTSHLYSHADAVNTLAWLPQTKTVLSTCRSNGIMACSLEGSPSPTAWTVAARIMDTRLDCNSTIVHLLPGGNTDKFIASTHKSDHLWNLGAGKEELVLSYDDYPPRMWLQHPRSESHAICVKQNAVHMYRWLDLSQVVSVSLEEYNLTGLSAKAAFFCGLPGTILLDLADANGSTGTKDVLLLDCGFLPEGDGDSTAEQPPSSADNMLHTLRDQHVGPSMKPGILSITRLEPVTYRIGHVIGIIHHPAKRSSKLVFLDTRSWVCSVELNESRASAGSISSYTRHFFVPYDWFAGTRCPVGAVTDQGTVVFAKRGDVAVIQGGLEYAEVVRLSPLAGDARGYQERAGVLSHRH
ncbi:WD40 repeat-like protein [Parathielavia appendiculata]|uniref:GPI inositol-deacylase n=1 Tax=Parathielavia appendiculata TaxID=2587402 RepID=A0AAN6U5Q1_9PEZI|nr:WD40 repeat-like protein [Parathielavia appendiculata]